MATLQLRPALLVVGLSLVSIEPAIAQLKPIVSSDVKHDISPSMKDWRPGPERPNFEEKTLEPVLPPPTPNEPQEDPAEQRIQGKPLPLTVNLGFDGLGDGVYGFTVPASPPDPTGAVGATQYVQWVNLSYAVFDKDTGDLLLGPIRGNRLWEGFGGDCETHNNGDPVVVYDKLADRWVLTQLSVRTGGPYFQCVAVSTSNDATDTFYRYAFQIRTFPDYGKLGVWPDAYYVGFNSGPNPVCAFEREAMLKGLGAGQQCFEPLQGFMLPSDLDGLTPPPEGSPNYFMKLGGNNQSVILNKFHVDFANPSESTFTGPITIPVDPFTRLGRVPQPETSNTLDTLSFWLMFRLAYRNFGDYESLVLNHSVQGSSGGGGVRWYEIQDPNGEPVVYQQGSFVPDSNYRWMGSIAMDQAGNIALGYSLSSTEIYPSVAITGRQLDDPLDTLGAEIILVDGTGSQTGTLGRWGDYSTMTVDPVDDCTFWYTAEYHKTSGRPWSTWIASFKFDSCGK